MPGKINDEIRKAAQRILNLNCQRMMNDGLTDGSRKILQVQRTRGSKVPRHNIPAMRSIVEEDRWWFDDPHRATYVNYGLLAPTVPAFWVYNPAYAQVQN
jgi:hypothetical protein